MLVRVNCDDRTVDIKAGSKAAARIAARLAVLEGVWVDPNRLYPPSRIVSIEVKEDDVR